MADVLMHEVVLVGLRDLEFKVGATLTKIGKAMELSIDGLGDDQLSKGDDRVVAYGAQKTHAKVSIKTASLSLNAKAALTGDTVVESGTTPNVVATYQFKAGAVPTGTLTGQVAYVQGVTGLTGTLPKDAHFVFTNFTIDPNSFKIGLKIGDKNTVDFSGTVIPDASDVIFQILLHETATTIT